jgi:isoleucyl-tRNA synthetase
LRLQFKFLFYFCLQEFEIDKTLGIKGPDDVAKMGIKNYNNECRKIVMRYASDWERIINRLGRWIGKFEIKSNFYCE